MSLHPQPVDAVPEDTRAVCLAAFPKGHLYITMRNTFEAFASDQDLAHLFPKRGQPTFSPWRLVMTTILQYAEGLSDQQAAHAVRSRIDWKYVLSLELTHPGFDPSVLCEFRARLVQGNAEHALFLAMLERFKQHDLLKAHGKQRTDSTHVLAAVRATNRTETVGEAMRHTLDALAVAAPAWLAAHVRPEWATRYDHRLEEYRLPTEPGRRKELAEQIGQDGSFLLQALWQTDTPAWLRQIPVVEGLRRIWVQQFFVHDGQLRFRSDHDAPPAAVMISSVLDQEARYAKKRTTRWTGYKVHLTETCDADTPHLVSHVQTTMAPIPDVEVTRTVHQDLQKQDLLMNTHLVDAGYMTAELLVTSQQDQIDLVGPALPSTSWQTRTKDAFDTSAFTIDWDNQQVLCPHGCLNREWYREPGQQSLIQVVFSAADCAPCPLRARCTNATSRGRTLRLHPQDEHEALQRNRVRQQTEAFRQCYALRAGIEGSISEAVRQYELRQCRYVGMAKTHLQHVLTAMAMNFVRVGRWLTNTPRRRTRTGAFERLCLSYS
jgi:transposase